WVQWSGEGDAIETTRTANTSFTVEGLEPGTLYNFSVWAEKNGVNSSRATLSAATDPSPPSIVSCISASGGYGVILTWSCPPGGYEAFKVEVGRQQFSQNGSSCGKGVSLSGLRPAQAYAATVTTIWDGREARSASVTCRTESTGEQSPTGTESYSDILSDPVRPCCEGVSPPHGVLFVYVLFPAFCKTAPLRCHSYNL
ncbi:Receptor-type tyrosine-protein phosphatase H, partial [Camelus dromedarius]